MDWNIARDKYLFLSTLKVKIVHKQNPISIQLEHFWCLILKVSYEKQKFVPVRIQRTEMWLFRIDVTVVQGYWFFTDSSLTMGLYSVLKLHSFLFSVSCYPVLQVLHPNTVQHLSAKSDRSCSYDWLKIKRALKTSLPLFRLTLSSCLASLSQTQMWSRWPLTGWRETFTLWMMWTTAYLCAVKTAWPVSSYWTWSSIILKESHWILPWGENLRPLLLNPCLDQQCHSFHF